MRVNLHSMVNVGMETICTGRGNNNVEWGDGNFQVGKLNFNKLHNTVKMIFIEKFNCKYCGSLIMNNNYSGFLEFGVSNSTY